MDKEHIFNLIHKVEETMIQTRRYLHENPEVSSKEYQTSQFLEVGRASSGRFDGRRRHFAAGRSR